VTEYDVQVGKIVAAHGLKGLVKVASLSDIPERYRTLKEVLVKTARAATLYQVVRAKETVPGTWLMELEGVTDRTQAEALRGAALMVPESESPPLPEGIYYTHQIMGLQVVTTDGRELGPVTDIIETGANDVYVTAKGLIPAIAQVVKQVDLAAGTMLIEPMPGLLEED
jgi:16S rRNA processing protein RimM